MSEIVDILERTFGRFGKHNESEGQISFNCPNCDMGRDKYKLELNYNKDVYKCWSCKDEVGGVKGKGVYWLLKKYADKKTVLEYKKIKPYAFLAYKEKELLEVDYPEGFTNFNKINENKRGYQKALKYLLRRNISMQDILKYNLGYTLVGDFKNRIIFPSYNEYDDLNYFVGRDFTDTLKFKYRAHENPKSKILFNEFFINWDKSVYIVEGVFDHIVLDNSIPILGKTISKFTHKKILENLNANLYVVLDNDAKYEAKILHETLNYGRLKKKVYIIDLPKNMDVSSLRNVTNYKKFYNSLRMGVREGVKCTF